MDIILRRLRRKDPQVEIKDHNPSLREKLLTLLSAGIIGKQDIDDFNNKENKSKRQLLEFESRWKVNELAGELMSKKDFRKVFSLDGEQGEEAVEKLKSSLDKIGGEIISKLNKWIDEYNSKPDIKDNPNRKIIARTASILFYGSRLSPRKLPRKDSDLDLAIFLDTEQMFSPTQLGDLNEAATFIAETVINEYLGVHIEVPLGGIIHDLGPYGRNSLTQGKMYLDEVYIYGQEGDVQATVAKYISS